MVHGTSYPNFKKEVCAHLCTLAPINSLALDIGAGAGIYADLLNKHYKIDAIEVFEPTVQYLKNTKKYNNIYSEDIRTYEFKNNYTLIILGDILEHLSIKDAQEVLLKCQNNCQFLMVAIPYNYKQGIINNNPAEVHLQDDLTKENFNERYPGFQLIFGNDVYGYYLKVIND